MFIKFYDLFVKEEVTLEVRDIKEITIIDGDLIIFNVDGLSFKTTQILFKGSDED